MNECERSALAEAADDIQLKFIYDTPKVWWRLKISASLS